MLPFLKPKPVAGVIVATRKPDGDGMDQTDDDQDAGFMSAAEDLIRSLHAKDAKGVAAAFRAAFDILDSEEAPGADDNSFDSQNMKAAKDSE